LTDVSQFLLFPFLYCQLFLIFFFDPPFFDSATATLYTFFLNSNIPCDSLSQLPCLVSVFPNFWSRTSSFVVPIVETSPPRFFVFFLFFFFFAVLVLFPPNRVDPWRPLLFTSFFHSIFFLFPLSDFFTVPFVMLLPPEDRPKLCVFFYFDPAPLHETSPPHLFLYRCFSSDLFIDRARVLPFPSRAPPGLPRIGLIFP